MSVFFGSDQSFPSYYSFKFFSCSPPHLSWEELHVTIANKLRIEVAQKAELDYFVYYEGTKEKLILVRVLDNKIYRGSKSSILKFLNQLDGGKKIAIVQCIRMSVTRKECDLSDLFQTQIELGMNKLNDSRVSVCKKTIL